MTLDAGENGDSIVLSSPTGSGKSKIFYALIHHIVDMGGRVALYAVRNTLLDQIHRQALAEGMHVGVVASEFSEEMDLSAPIQLCMLQTVNARINRWKKAVAENPNGTVTFQAMDKLLQSDIVIVDEAHQQRAAMAVNVFEMHKENGGYLAGFSATPAGLSHIYDECVQLVTNSELRQTDPPMHLLCDVYSSPEFDTRDMKIPAKSGEFSKSQIDEWWKVADEPEEPSEDGEIQFVPDEQEAKRVKRENQKFQPHIFGHILDEFMFINAELRPTLLFAPGVPHSKWITDCFNDAGFSWAHIDGFDVYRDGRSYRSSRQERRAALRDLENGSLVGISNRFVLREGIDLPCLGHMVLACPIGSLESYVQAVGRLLRYHTSLDRVSLQDHGGNWWRHGSPNANRDWREAFRTSSDLIRQVRERALADREIQLPEPCPECKRLILPGRKCPCQREEQAIVCPQCGEQREWGDACHKCGYRPIGKKREIIGQDGRLISVTDHPVPQRIRRRKNDTVKKWERCYMRAMNSKNQMTFAQAEQLFHYENHYYPPKDLKLMPKIPALWFARVCETPKSELY